MRVFLFLAFLAFPVAAFAGGCDSLTSFQRGLVSPDPGSTCASDSSGNIAVYYPAHVDPFFGGEQPARTFVATAGMFNAYATNDYTGLDYYFDSSGNGIAGTPSDVSAGGVSSLSDLLTHLAVSTGLTALVPNTGLGASPVLDGSDPGYAEAVTDNFPTTYVLAAFLVLLGLLVAVKVAKSHVGDIVRSVD